MNSYEKWLERQEDAAFEKTYKKRTKNVQKTYRKRTHSIKNVQKRKSVTQKRTKNVLIIIL